MDPSGAAAKFALIAQNAAFGFLTGIGRIIQFSSGYKNNFTKGFYLLQRSPKIKSPRFDPIIGLNASVTLELSYLGSSNSTAQNFSGGCELSYWLRSFKLTRAFSGVSVELRQRYEAIT